MNTKIILSKKVAELVWWQNFVL